MDLNSINVTQDEARLHFRHYRRAVQERHRLEDEILMRGYRALSLGKRVIALTTTIRSGGFNENRTPKLAVCRADAERCKLDVDPSGVLNMRMDGVRQSGRAKAGTRFVFPRMATRVAWNADGYVDAMAIVPIVPPNLRPADSLDRYHVLWEAEWTTKRAPKDPALLRHIAGDLFAVLATWDLTPLERAVLLGTRVS